MVTFWSLQFWKDVCIYQRLGIAEKTAKTICQSQCSRLSLICLCTLWTPFCLTFYLPWYFAGVFGHASFLFAAFFEAMGSVIPPDSCPLSGAEKALCRLAHSGPRPHPLLRPLQLELSLYVQKTLTKQKKRYSLS